MFCKSFETETYHSNPFLFLLKKQLVKTLERLVECIIMPNFFCKLETNGNRFTIPRYLIKQFLHFTSLNQSMFLSYRKFADRWILRLWNSEKSWSGNKQMKKEPAILTIANPIISFSKKPQKIWKKVDFSYCLKNKREIGRPQNPGDFFTSCPERWIRRSLHICDKWSLAFLLFWEM